MLIRRPRPGDGNKPCCIQYGLVYVDMTSAFVAIHCCLMEFILLGVCILAYYWSLGQSTKYSPVRFYTNRMNVQDNNIHVAMPKWYTVKTIK